MRTARIPTNETLRALIESLVEAFPGLPDTSVIEQTKTFFNFDARGLRCGKSIMWISEDCFDEDDVSDPVESITKTLEWMGVPFWKSRVDSAFVLTRRTRHLSAAPIATRGRWKLSKLPPKR